MLLDSTTELRLTKLLSALADYKASDLHFSVGIPPSFRMAGSIVPLAGEALVTAEFVQTLVDALLTPVQQQQLAAAKSVVFGYTFKGKTRYKVHVYHQRGYPSVTFRYLPPRILPVSQLAVPAAVKKLATIEHGLIIIAGAYGSGKTTLLAGVIEEYNQTSAKHIMTFERPIELLLTDSKSMIEQCELGQDVMNIAEAVHLASAEDIDMIGISTVVDAASVRAACQLAQMGKLVLFEVTAPTIRSALDSLMGVFMSTEQTTMRTTLADVFQAAVALTAIPNTAGGVSVAAEVLRLNPGVYSVLRQENFDKIPMIIEHGHNDGMVTLEQSRAELVAVGLVSQHL